MCGMAKKDDQQTNVRLPAALKERITQAATESGRSFTAEMVARLEASFESVFEATLLQARLAERDELLRVRKEYRKRVDALHAEVHHPLPSPDQMSPALAHRLKEIVKETELIESELQRLNDYYLRVQDDIAVLSDGLSERLRQHRALAQSDDVE